MRNPFSSRVSNDYYSPYLEDDEFENDYYGYDIEPEEDDYLY